MNELIKKIAEQAGMEDYPDYGINTLYGDETIEKFAELIVKECAKVANDNYNKGFCPVGDIIKNHFGVE